MSKVYSGVFDAFHVHRQQNVSALQWRATGDITSFTIEHSFDGTYFNFVADVSPDGSTWNRYQHADALPGYNYYRITAHMADGTTEYSETVVLRIVSRK
jgi:hypothetical protein